MNGFRWLKVNAGFIPVNSNKNKTNNKYENKHRWRNASLLGGCFNFDACLRNLNRKEERLDSEVL